jgi:DNA-directed RNA polymerase subunit H (RpoH/RPB5)
MKRSGALVFIGMFVLAAAGCTPSYPKADIEDSVQKIVKKEYNIDSRAHIVGSTLYLDIKIPDLATTKPKDLTKVLEKVQGAVLSITRVSLSSDAHISYMVVTASDPAWKLGLRVIQNLQDVKNFLYQRISHDDYGERLVLEIDSADDGMVPGKEDYAPDRDILLEEFAGRLIVSQFNMLGRNNPFLGLLMGSMKLKYAGFAGGELVIRASGSAGPEIFRLIEKILVEESNKVVKKYDLIPMKTIKLISPNNQELNIAVK